MSGPKIDHAEIERQKRAEIEQARQERLRKIRQETARLDAEMSKASSQIDVINSHSAYIINSMKNVSEMSNILREINELKSKQREKLINITKFDIPTEPDALAAKSSEIAKDTADIMQCFNQEIAQLIKRITEYKEQMQAVAELDTLSKKLNSGAEKVAKVEDLDFSFKTSDIDLSGIETNIQEKAKDILSDIESLINSESIQESDISQLISIANSIYKQAFISNDSFGAAVVEFETVKPQIEKSITLFDAAYQNYCAEFAVYASLLNEYEQDSSHTIRIIEKCQFASIDELYNEIDYISRQSQALSEKNYIRKQIDDVMNEFGYNMSEEIVFNLNQTGSSYICKNAEKETAIHIRLSSKKTIMMEVVGLGESNAVTDNTSINGAFNESPNLSESKKSFLFNEQSGFCNLHPKIVEELGKRGVILNKKSRIPPDPNNCREFLSVTNKNITTEPQREYNTRANERRNAVNKTKLRELKYKG